MATVTINGQAYAKHTAIREFFNPDGGGNAAIGYQSGNWVVRYTLALNNNQQGNHLHIKFDEGPSSLISFAGGNDGVASFINTTYNDRETITKNVRHPIYFAISTDPNAFTNAGKSNINDAGVLGKVAISGKRSWNSGTELVVVCDADVVLLPNTTYYLWFFPGYNDWGLLYWNNSSMDITLTGTAQYPITYNANGGSGVPASQNKIHNSSLTLSTTRPTRTGYTFQGWNTKSDGSGTSYQPGATYASNAALTLYAQWKIKTYTVSYDANGGSGVPGAQTKTHGVGLTLSTTKPTRTGYTFQGWATSANGSVSYASGASYTSNATITLYAVWKANEYTVSYNANGGSGAPASQTKTHGINLTLRSTWPTKANAVTNSTGQITVTYNKNGGSSTPAVQTGTYTNQSTTPYSFAHWNTASNNGGTTYYPGGTYSANAHVTLYAQYQAGNTTTIRYSNPSFTIASAIRRDSISAGSYIITYDANGGSCSKSSDSAARTTSYTFAGWNKNSNGSGTNYSAGTVQTFGENTTLYAQWNSTTTTAAITLPTPTRTGYTFKGWSASSSATSGSTGSYVPSGNITLYATWQINPYTITIQNSSYGTVKNGNTTIGSGSKVNYGTELTITPTAITGYTTTVSSSTGTINNNKLIVDNDETITFTRTENTYYIYYNKGLADSGSLPNTTSRKFTANAILGTNSMTKNKTTDNSYTVTYNKGNADSTNVPSSQTSINTTTYAANGWVDNPTAMNWVQYANGATIQLANTASNKTLYPNFTPTTTNGGVTLSSNTMTKNNSTASGYTVTYKRGIADSTNVPSLQTTQDTIAYTHTGWATTQTGNKVYDKGATIKSLSSDLKLYPTFSSNVAARGFITLATNNMTKSDTLDQSYVITYCANYSGAPSDQKVTVTKTRHYTANGWTTSSNSSSRTYANGASVQMNGNLTLYPCFDQTTSGGSTTLLSPTRPGYVFNGWSTSPSASNGITGTYTPTSDITLYATWTNNTYTATFDANGGSAASPNKITKEYNSELGTLPTTTRTGYTFNGWYTAKDGGTLISSTTKLTDHITYYAHWTINSYELRIDPNGGHRVPDNITGIVTVTKEYGTTERISERQRIGYTLTGYTVKNTSNGSTTDVGGASFSFNDSTKEGNFTQGTTGITLIANWTPNIYSVTLDHMNANKAGTTAYWYLYNTTKTINNEIVYYYTDAECTIPLTNYTITIPAKTGYIFGGYYTDKDGNGTQYINANGMCINNIYSNLTQNSTLYAKWIPITYTVSYDANGGKNAPATQIKTHNVSLQLASEIPTREGYEFLGWSLSKTGVVEAQPGNIFKGNRDLTLYAIWQSIDALLFTGHLPCIYNPNTKRYQMAKAYIKYGNAFFEALSFINTSK